MHTKNSGRFAVDENFLQFRTAPKMMMDRKRNWAENETDLKTKIPKTKLVRNWQICSFGAKNENEIRSVSNYWIGIDGTKGGTTVISEIFCFCTLTATTFSTPTPEKYVKNPENLCFTFMHAYIFLILFLTCIHQKSYVYSLAHMMKQRSTYIFALV